MKKSTKLIAVLMAAAMIIGLAGCTGGTTAATTAAPAATEAAKESKTLTIVNGNDIDEFNPFTQQQTAYITFFVFNCYEPLFHLNEKMEYDMDLATKVEQKDDTTIVITTRENVKFHNGQSFGPEDVVYAIQKTVDPATGAWRSPQYENVESIEATGANEVTIKLKSAAPSFLDNLAYTPIVCKDDDPAQMAQKVNGTGAYKFVNWVPNDSINFEKYADYWDSAKINFDKLVVKPVPDASVAITNLETGAVDLYNSITVEAADMIESKAGLKVISAKASNTVDLFEIGRHNFEPFHDPEVLRAMFLALDRQTINESVYGGKGKATTSMYPSATRYHIDSDNEGYDIEKAKEVLAATPYKDGFEFDLEVLAGFAAAEQEAIIWQADLAKLGIKMNVKVEEMSVWLDAYLNRTYQMIWNSYGMVGSDPATFNSIIISQLFDYQAKDIPELKELVDAGASTSDDAVRKETYEKIQKIVAEYRPVAPFIEAPLLYGATESLTGLEINGMGHMFLKNVNK